MPGSRVWVSTFHSLGARLLRQYADRLGLDRNFTIYDQDDRNRLVKDALEARRHRQRPLHARSAIGGGDQQGEEPAADAGAVRASEPSDFFTQTVAKVYPVYEKRLRDANAMDFDDLLYWPALALKHDEELRAELDARFRFVLIDEYQDTNYAQYAIARGLSRRLPEPVRRRRSRPIDLQVARLGHPEHPRLRARLPRRPRHHAGPELPQHEGDPARGRAR